MSCYDKDKMVTFYQATVEDVIKKLQTLPADCKVNFCGSQLGYLHVVENESFCSFDTECDDFYNEYEDDACDENSLAYGDDDGSQIGCSDCPTDECTGHCMSCAYRPI